MEKKKKKFKKAVLLLFPLLIIYYLSSIYFVKEIYYYNSSKSFMTYVVYASIILTALFMVIFTIRGFKCIKKNKTKSYVWYFIFIILFIIGELFVSINISKISNSLSKITNRETGYSTSLVTLSSSKISAIKDLDDDSLIGMISDTNNVEGYKLPMEIIKSKKIDEKRIVSYDDFNSMLEDLYNKKIDAMFVSSSYVSMFASLDGYENIGNDTKVIYEKSKKAIKKTSQSNKTLNEPFTLLIMGVDSTSTSLKKSNSFNGDTLMLITFNPNTMNATILSIPRDTRVPIVCTRSKAKNKINATGAYGADCVMDTITNFTGIKIDYWVKVNFKGVVSLVDALGGVDIDVPYSFCEQDSNREFGNSTIYIEKGRQTLNGEQALAFARNRHPWPQYCGKKYSNYTSNDFVRGQNQQQIVKAMANKLKDVRSLSQLYKLLDIAGDNLDTNIDKDTMITGFDTFKNIIFNSKNINNEDFVGTQRLYLSGYDNTINGIYYFEYSTESLKEIVDAMKINLEIKKPEMDKEFSFSINSPYEDTQIGKGTYKK